MYLGRLGKTTGWVAAAGGTPGPAAKPMNSDWMTLNHGKLTDVTR